MLHRAANGRDARDLPVEIVIALFSYAKPNKRHANKKACPFPDRLKSYH